MLGHTTQGRREFCIHLEKLLATRMFIQAASGGGKSFALRRLLEQTHGRVQQIVLDPEGELVSLADKFRFTVLTAEGDGPVLTATGGYATSKLVHRSGHSVILNLEGFEVEEMQLFVADFIRGLMAVPKDQWRHVLLVVDEGQLFAPQQDKAESKKPMLDLAARARKRGICPVIATQRISQLHKGVVAHLDNKLVGLTTLENDVERAAEQLGMRVPAAAQVLRGLSPGEFLAYGPALGYEVTKITVGPVATRHGDLGKFTGKAPRKALSRAKLLNELKAIVPPPKPAAPGEAAPSPSLDQGLQIAQMRHWVISPLLARDTRRGALAARARELQLPKLDVSRWLQAFKTRFDLQDLRPLHIRRSALATTERLARLREVATSRDQSALGTDIMTSLATGTA